MSQFLEMLVEAGNSLVRFWSLSDASVRTALAGVLCLGLGTGVLGPFLVLRRMALLGDSLGHAVLPGVCLGFLVTATKDPRWIFSGALLSAAAAGWVMQALERHSRLKPDVILGLVLSGFFALGTLLLTRLQSLPYGSQSGLNQYLFGQASALLEEDIPWLLGMSLLLAGGVMLMYKELLLTSFDEGFAQSLGYPVVALQYLLMTFVGFAIVISLQAVGLVLLSALLITPAVTARMWTDRLPTMLLISVGLSMICSVLGLNLSFLGRSQPTGPYIVLALSGAFAVSLLISPREGLLPQYWRRRRQAQRARQENLLRGVLEVLMSHQHADRDSHVPEAQASTAMAVRPLTRPDWVTVDEVALALDQPRLTLESELEELVQHGWLRSQGQLLSLTELGQSRAAELIRNYRLWEEFLVRRINLPSDHTRPGAEQLEHILGPDLVEQLQIDLARDQEQEGNGSPSDRQPLEARLGSAARSPEVQP